MKNIFQYKIPISIIALCLLFGCNKDDDIIQQPEEPEVPEEPAGIEISEAFTFLTDNSQSEGNEEGKVWKVGEAELANANGTFNIAGLPNIEDDEFIFIPDESGFGVRMVWRPRNAVRLNADSPDEALLDFYLSPLEYTGVLNEDDPGKLIFEDGAIVVEIISADSIIIEIAQFPDGRQQEQPVLRLGATPKTAQDYNTIPSTLEFTKLTDIEGAEFISGAPGFTSSLVTNKLYWAHRMAGSEHVWNYDLETGEIDECITDISDFVSKQLHVINDELKVIGGQYVNTYGLDLTGGGTASCNPVSESHGLLLSRFGSAVLDNSIYIFGGDLNEVDSDKIFRYNDETNSLEQIATMPSPKSWANGEIVDRKLYVFGGQAQFSGTPSEDVIYIYDFETDSFETGQLPETVYRTFAARNENLIYVTGQKTNDEVDIFLGVYNTLDDTFTEIPSNLSDEGTLTIHQMTAMDNKLYVLYGGEDTAGNAQFSIQVTDL